MKYHEEILLVVTVELTLPVTGRAGEPVNLNKSWMYFEYEDNKLGTEVECSYAEHTECQRAV